MEKLFVVEWTFNFLEPFLKEFCGIGTSTSATESAGPVLDYFHLQNDNEVQISAILQYRSKNWNWLEVSKHPNITLDDIRNHPELP